MFASNSATDGSGSYGAVEVDCIRKVMAGRQRRLRFILQLLQTATAGFM